MPDLNPAYIFVSDQVLGTGSPQSIPHNLAIAPERVLAYLVGGPAIYAAPSITMGTHTDTDLVVTVTDGWTYRVLAFA
jgi:hypothetical protein